MNYKIVVTCKPLMLFVPHLFTPVYTKLTLQFCFSILIQQLVVQLLLYSVQCTMNIFNILAEGPGVAREKKSNFLAFNPSWPPMSVHKKFQPNRSSRLAGYTQHIYIYECLVLLYRFKMLTEYVK